MSLDNSNTDPNEANIDDALLSTTPTNDQPELGDVNPHLRDGTSSGDTSSNISGSKNNNNKQTNSLINSSPLLLNGSNRTIANLAQSSMIMDLSYLNGADHLHQPSNDWTTSNEDEGQMGGSPLSTSPLSSSSSPSSSSASTSSSELNPSDALQSPLTGLLDFEGFSMPQIGNFGYSLTSLANLDMPNFSDLASLPTMPTLPSFNMPNLAHLQNFANLPNLPNLTNLPNLPNLPNLARFRPTNLPNLPTLPHLPLFSASFARNSLLKSWSHLMESVRNMHKRLNDITQRFPTNFHFREWRAHDGTPMIRVYFILNDALFYCDSYLSERASTINHNKLFNNNGNKSDSNTNGSKEATDKDASGGHHSSNKHRSNRTIHQYHQLDIKNLHTQLPHPTSLVSTSHDTINNLRRLQQTNSIANYEYDPKSSRFVFSLGTNLYYFDDHPGCQPPVKEPPHIPIRLETNHFCHKSQPQICPSNPDLIAFYSDGDLWCINMKTGQEVRLTDSISSVMKLNPHHPMFIDSLAINSNKHHVHGTLRRPSPTALESSPILIGRPSHVIQEEFKRHESFWWRPDGEYHVVVGSDEYSEYEIMFEETNQSMVDIVRIPSWDGQVEEFRYPRTGTTNATSKLRLVRFKLSNSDNRIYDITQVDIPAKLKEVYPDYEYLVRIGWLSQDAIWCQMLNRHQTNLVLVLISLSNSFRPQILHEDKSDSHWINVHDVIHFLNVPKIDCQPLAKGAELTFVWSSEETGHRHLYLIRAQLTGDDSCTSYSISGENHEQSIDDNSGIIDVEIDGISHSATFTERATNSIVKMDESPHRDPGTIISNGDNNNVKNDSKIKYNYPSSGTKRSKQSQLRSKIIFKKQLTFGEWEVSDKEFWVDENEMLIYFCGLKETPLEKQLYVLSYADYLLHPNSKMNLMTDGPSTSSSSQTANMRHTKIRRLTESNFSHSYIAFNNNCNIFINIQSNISIPPFGFVNRICRPEKALEHNSSGQKFTPNQAVKLSHLPDSKRLAMLLVNSINYPSSCVLNSAIASSNSSGNSESKNRQVNYLMAIGRRQSILLDCEADQIDLLPGLAKPELFSYKLSSGDVVYGFIFKPEFMESGMRYPTILEVYGGPEIQQVSNSFMSVRQPKRHLLSSEGYVVVSFDCRGSSHRGLAFEAHVHRRMGQVEINDQVEVLQWLSKNTGYIDLNRVAIQGWSYGGYLSLMALAQRPDVFKIAIAGAPVTNWFLYDTGYTERYMDLPLANVDGYNKGNVSNYANQFPSEENRLLLLHGLMDENVHFSHTVSFIQALIRAGKPYSLQVYPEERHSLRHSKSCEHFETCILSYLQLYL